MTIDKNIQNILQKEENKMLNYLEWYNTLPGDLVEKLESIDTMPNLQKMSY